MVAPAALGFVVVVGAMYGCGGSEESDCESLCTAQSKCGTTTQTTDCPTACKAAISQAANAGCSSQASDAYSCASGLSSDEICGKTASTGALSCAEKILTYTQCITNACTANPAKCATTAAGTTGTGTTGGTTSSTGTGG